MVEKWHMAPTKTVPMSDQGRICSIDSVPVEMQMRVNMPMHPKTKYLRNGLDLWRYTSPAAARDNAK